MSVYQPQGGGQAVSPPRASIPAVPRRRCAEVCMDLLAIEALRTFSEKQRGPAAGAALEAVGVRVGHQLAERGIEPPRRLLHCGGRPQGPSSM
eukprot:gene4067-14156_t